MSSFFRSLGLMQQPAQGPPAMQPAQGPQLVQPTQAPQPTTVANQTPSSSMISTLSTPFATPMSTTPAATVATRQRRPAPPPINLVKAELLRLREENRRLREENREIKEENRKIKEENRRLKCTGCPVDFGGTIHFGSTLYFGGTLHVGDGDFRHFGDTEGSKCEYTMKIILIDSTQTQNNIQDQLRRQRTLNQQRQRLQQQHQQRQQEQRERLQRLARERQQQPYQEPLRVLDEAQGTSRRGRVRKPAGMVQMTLGGGMTTTNGLSINHTAIYSSFKDSDHVNLVSPLQMQFDDKLPSPKPLPITPLNVQELIPSDILDMSVVN
ncbi:ras-interacting protein RIP3-like [Haliotis rufescens]|uniref:ras-interacting protein RIP3-like n=1 Tax=Haliotis rufescens TaxID=6454 RepID=UPI00201F2884|nr:ras-interacting protein RIP3-like [Haliotis rufescens]